MYRQVPAPVKIIDRLEKMATGAYLVGAVSGTCFGV